MLGGEHLVTLGAFRAVAEKFPDVHVIHFDAHADLREDYLGVSLSHACVLRRCWELVGNGRIFQFGIRSGDREEFQWGRTHVKTNRFDFATLEEVIDQLQDKPVYFTLDLDVLDPSVFPGTGTPEPGGVSFEQLRQAATLVCSKLRVVGCDVNELSPHYDPSGVSTIVACKIVREMLLAFQK
jgi:agmatinase